MTSDLESRRRAIVRALTGIGERRAEPASPTLVEPDPASDVLAASVERLETRVDALTAAVDTLRAAERSERTPRPAARTVRQQEPVPAVPTIPSTVPHDDGDDGVVVRASVPPLDLDAFGSSAFDVLLGAGSRSA